MNSAVTQKLKSFKLWAIFAAVAVAVWGLAFYWISRPTRSQKLEIWLGAEFDLKAAVKQEIAQAAKPYGIKKCDVNSYDPADTYYAQAFSLRANSVDIYILKLQTAETLMQTHVFSPIEFELDGVELWKPDGSDDVYGVKFVGEYYIFVNSASKKEGALLRDVVKVLTEAGRGL